MPIYSTNQGKSCPRCSSTVFSYSQVAFKKDIWRADCFRCGLKHYFRHLPSKVDRWGGADCPREEVAQAHRESIICVG